MSKDFIIIEEPILINNKDNKCIIGTAWDDTEINKTVFNKHYKVKYEIIDKGTIKRKITINNENAHKIIAARIDSGNTRKPKIRWGSSV